MTKRVSVPKVAILRVVKQKGKKGFIHNRRFVHDITAACFSAHDDGDKLPILVFEARPRMRWTGAQLYTQKRMGDQQAMLYSTGFFGGAVTDKCLGAWLNPHRFEVGTTLVIAGHKEDIPKPRSYKMRTRR